MEKQKKMPRITRKMLVQKKAGCTTCRHYEENDNGVGVCFATFSGGQGARGARAEDKYCGMAGKLWQAIIKTSVPRGVAPAEELEASTEYSEEELSQMSPQKRGAIKRKQNAKAKGGVGEGS